MRIETICTGDELLTGLTADTNSRHFQEELLARTGLTVRRSVVVGDVAEDIVEALTAAAARCQAVLVSGGLGPTADDITVDCAARAFGVEVVEHPLVMQHLQARYAARGFALTPNNRRQAHVPTGAEVELNQEGAAPLIIHRFGDCTFFFVPGVPREYRHLVSTHVIPRLDALAGGARPATVLRVLRTLGLPESVLDAKVQPLHARHPHVVFGFRTHPPENQLKLLARGATPGEAQARAAAAEAEARALLGEDVFGADEETLPQVVHAALRRRGETVAVAESLTGGLIGALLTQPPGASEVVYGAAVTYSEAAKQAWAGVPGALLATHGAVSAEVAAALAEGIRAASGASWGLSATGYAGPSGGEAVGTVYLGTSHAAQGTKVSRQRFPFDRERIRHFAAGYAVDFLRRRLTETKTP